MKRVFCLLMALMVLCGVCGGCAAEKLISVKLSEVTHLSLIHI